MNLSKKNDSFCIIFKKTKISSKLNKQYSIKKFVTCEMLTKIIISKGKHAITF